MSVIIREVKNSADRNLFVSIPFLLYKNNPYWVPPMKAGEKKMLCREKNPAFDFCDATFWIAEKDGKAVGRIGAIVNNLYNKKMDEQIGCFTRFEAIDDQDVVDNLMLTAENWIRSRNMKGIHGPLGFSNLDHQGVLVEGFNYVPSIASEYHHEYYHHHFERLGYEKEKDWLEFRLTIPDAIPEKVKRVSEIIIQRNSLQIVRPKNKKEIINYADKVFEIFNSAFEELFSTFPFNQRMSTFILNKFLPILNSNFVRFILSNQNEVIGFIISIPSLSKAMQKAKGRLFPFGFQHIKKALNHPDEVDLLLTGVRSGYTSLGLPAIMMTELYEQLVIHGIKHVETTGMQEQNHVAIQSWKSWEHIQHKRKRCYKKMFT